MSAIVTNEIQDSVSSLYIAFFGRAPDAKGFGYWTEEMAGGVSPYAIAADFARSDEWISNYGGLTPTQQVTLFYNNVFDRDPDQDGLDYWVGEIENGTPVSAVAYQIIWAAYLGGEGVDPADNAIVLNKIAVAEYFAIDLKSNDTAIAATAFDGVTQDVATVQAAEDRLDAAVNPAVTYTLTTGIDRATANEFDGTINNADSTKNTLNPGDNLTGGTGTNTLDVVASGTGSQTVSGFTLTGVQNVTVQNADTTATNTLTLGMGSATGVTSLTNTLSSANVAFTDVGAIADLNVTNAQADTSVAYKTAVVSGTANSQNITLNGANTTVSGTVTVNGIETFNVTTAGAASGSSTKSTTLASNALQTVNVAGDQTASLVVDLSGYASTTKTGTFDAGDATAAITATLTIDANDKLAVTGGSGNDVFTINNLGNAVTVTGGEGTDTVKTSATNLNQTQIANVAVENLNFTAGSTTLNLTGNNNITGVAYEAGFGASTAAGIASGTTFTTHDVGTSLGVTLRSTTPTDDTLNIVIGKTGTSGSDGIAAGTITATGVEVMNFTSQAKTTPTTGATNSVTVAGTSLDTVTVAGSTKFALTQAGGSVKSYDASDATGVQDTSGITFKSSGATISGGSANDILTGGTGADSIEGNDGNDSVTGGAGNDQLFGGAGNDTLIAGTGKDTMTGGDGVDVFQFADGDSVSSTINTVTDFVSGTDRLSIGQTNTKFIGNFSDIDTALAAMTATNQSFFVTSSNQVYVVNKQGELQSSDEVVKLTGVTQLTSADLGLGPLGPGNDITLTAASAVVNLTTNTGATAKSTNLDDTVYSLAAYLVGSSVDGALGENTLVMSDAITGEFTLGATAGATSAAVINTQALQLYKSTANNLVIADGTSVAFDTITLGDKGDTLDYGVAAANNGGTVVVTGGAKDDSISFTTSVAGKTSVVGGAGNDTVTFGAIYDGSSAAHSVDGGTGDANQLKVTGDTTISFANSTLTNIQQLVGDGDDNIITITNSQFSMFDTINMVSADADDRVKFAGKATYDLTAKTVTTDTDWELLTAGSTLKGNAAQLAQDVIGTGATGGDTLQIANDANYNATSKVTKFQTVSYTGNTDKTLTMAVANFYKGTNGSTADDGASTVTGSGTSNLVAGDTGASLNLTAVTVSGFDAITFASTGNDTLTVDVADLQGVTLSSGGTAANLAIFNGSTSTGTVDQDLSSLIITASKFDTLSFGKATAGYITNLTVSEKALVTGLATIAGAENGTENLIVNASTASANITQAAVTAVTNLDSITLNGSTGNNVVTLSGTDAVRKITTVDISQGGADTVVLSSDAVDAAGNQQAIIEGFFAGVSATATTLKLTGYAGFVSAATAGFDVGDMTALSLLRITTANRTVTDLTATADGGAVETAIAAAADLTGMADGEDFYVALGGSGASFGNTGIYRVDLTAKATETMDVELIAILDSASVNDLVASNFLAI